MRTVSIACFAILWLNYVCATPACGQTPPTSAEALAAAEKRLAALEGDVLTTVPERIWTTAEADTIKLPLRDVELVDRKFRGTVRLQLPLQLNYRLAGELNNSWQHLSNETRALFASPNGPLLFSYGTGTLKRPRASEYFRTLIERTPEDQRPAAELLDYLKSPAADQEIAFSNSGKEIYLNVLGKTSEEVESRIKAVVQLLDAAMHQSTRRELLESAQASLPKAKAYLDQQLQLEAERKALTERMNAATAITPELLTHLQAQQITLGVEIDGLEAELKACDQLLQDKKRTEQERDAARDTRVRSELELARQRAKLARTSALIQEGEEQAGRRREKAELATKIANAGQKMINELSVVTSRTDVINLLAPLTAVDDTIRIAPIEWVTR